MRFQTPQFIEVEDRIFGPLTLKQFIYLAGTGGVCFMLYSFLPLLIAIPLMIPVITIGLAMAFYKINNKPFIQTVEAAFKFIFGAKLYVWRKGLPKASNDDKSKSKDEDASLVDELNVPHMSESKLKEIAWSLDVHDIHEQKQHEEDNKNIG